MFYVKSAANIGRSSIARLGSTVRHLLISSRLLPGEAEAGEGGAAIVMAAAFLVILLGFTALSVDVGLLYLKRRQLQTATDAAAMAATQNTASPDTIAASSLVLNGFTMSNIALVTRGTYQPNPSLAASARFGAGGTAPNAVRLQTTMQAPLYFMRSMLPDSMTTINATATAARIDEAAVTAGSGQVSLTSGLANALLGKMLGTSINLTAVQYNGLANTSVSALSFLDALAAQLGLSAGTYAQVLSANATAAQIVAAGSAVLSKQGTASSAASSALDALTLLGAQLTANSSFPLSKLIDVGIWRNEQVGSVPVSSAASATVNLYQLTSLAAQLANGANAVSLNDTLNIPGIATGDIYMTTIEPTQPSAPHIMLGPVGTTVHTSQIRLLLNFTLLNGFSFLGSTGVVNLPIYIEIGSGTATLTGISCGSQPGTDTTVTIAAQPSAVSAYIAQVSPSLMTNFSQPVSTNTPATLVNLLGLAQITAKSTVTVGSGSATNLTFTRAQMAAGQSQTVTSSGMVSNLLGTLVTSTQLQVTALGLPLLPAVTSALTASLRVALAPLATGVDLAVGQLLATLGIGIGNMVVTAPGARCGMPALVL